ncbi:MAG: helix-turn-helix transcriptional regulator [Polyangiaceae bacterium]|jgi:transcriptional regulator with XRE-family HTH domain
MAPKVKKTSASEYVPARVRVELTPGESVRVARELQAMTQTELAAASGIPQGTISSIESGRARLGAERAEKLARALKVHPAVLLWPNWDVDSQSQRAAGQATG